MIFIILVFIAILGAECLFAANEHPRSDNRITVLIAALIYAIVVGGLIAFLFGQIMGIPSKWKTEKKIIIPFENVSQAKYQKIFNRSLERFHSEEKFMANEKTIFIYDDTKLYFMCRSVNKIKKIVIKSSPRIKIRKSSKNYSYLLVKTPVFGINFWRINFGNSDYHEYEIYINKKTR